MCILFAIVGGIRPLGFLMATSQKCVATTLRGLPCKAWALIGSDLCREHVHTGPTPTLKKRVNCRCPALPFPHRAGTGGCKVDPESLKPLMVSSESRELTANKQRKPKMPFDKAAQIRYLKLVAQGQRRMKAADILGVSRGAVTRALETDPVFSEKVELAELQACEVVEDGLWKLATGETTGMPHFDAIKMYLFNRAPERWRDPRKLEVNVSGSVDHQLEVGPVLERIEILKARLTERQALGQGGDVVEAEVIGLELLEDEG